MLAPVDPEHVQRRNESQLIRTTSASRYVLAVVNVNKLVVVRATLDSGRVYVSQVSSVVLVFDHARLERCPLLGHQKTSEGTVRDASGSIEGNHRRVVFGRPFQELLLIGYARVGMRLHDDARA